MSNRLQSSLRRRTFLQAAGLTGASFFLPTAHSAPEEAPRRIIFLIGNQGWVRRNWAMLPPDAPATLSQYADTYDPEVISKPDEDEWEFDLTGLAEEDFSVGLKPLWRHRSRLLALDGLSLRQVTAQDEFGDAHAKGWVASTTGNVSGRPLAGPRSHAASPSIDQIIAANLRQADPNLTDLVSLEYTLSSPFPFHHYIYGKRPDGSTVKLPAETSPQKAFERLFPDAQVGAQKNRIVDVVAGRYDALQSRLSGEDQAKLGLHRDLLRDVQHRLQVLNSVSCVAPTPYEKDKSLSSGERFPLEFDAFSDLVVTAMSCGLTRVASIQLGGVPAELIGGSQGEDVHHEYAHPSHPKKEFDPSAFDKWERGIKAMTQHMVVYTEQMAKLADKLDQVPEGGGTMLDNTLIVLLNELSHGGHGHDQFPVTMVGGFGGAYRTGRYIRWARNVPTPRIRKHGRQYVGHPHTQLLVSFAQQMGVDVNDLGLKSVEGSAHEGPSATIDLTGPLARLA